MQDETTNLETFTIRLFFFQTFWKILESTTYQQDVFLRTMYPVEKILYMIELKTNIMLPTIDREK